MNGVTTPRRHRCLSNGVRYYHPSHRPLRHRDHLPPLYRRLRRRGRPAAVLHRHPPRRPVAAVLHGVCDPPVSGGTRDGAGNSAQRTCGLAHRMYHTSVEPSVFSSCPRRWPCGGSVSTRVLVSLLPSRARGPCARSRRMSSWRALALRCLRNWNIVM